EAEDGIGYGSVTGVQTCALPIYRRCHSAVGQRGDAVERAAAGAAGQNEVGGACGGRGDDARRDQLGRDVGDGEREDVVGAGPGQIGRASCRGGGEEGRGGG